MALNITNLFYSEQDIGATLKISKRQYIWEFDLNGSSQRIELLDSRLSRKKRLFKNGVSILKTTEDGNFIHNFEIDGHPCVIIQYGDKIELRIDNQSFTHLYNLQKNKQLFAGEKGPTSNIYVAKAYNSYGSTNNKSKGNDDSTFYKVNKPEEENKPKLFNFEIKKDGGNKTQGLAKFKFGQNKDKPSFNSNNNNNNIQNNKINNNNGNVDLLGMQNDNLNGNNNVNNNNNNNNLLDFGQNNNGNNNQNVQSPQKSGNDIFDLFGNGSNNNNNNNQNNNNLNNNNPYNNIFLQISDGTNQKPNFDQNNMGFLNMGNNNNMDNNMTNNMGNNIMMNNNQNNNFLNGQNNNNTQNQPNNSANIDLLNF